MQGYFAVEGAISRSAGAKLRSKEQKKNSALSPAPYSELLGALDSETRTNENEDFLNTEYCSRVNQRHFGGKTRQSSFYYEF